MHSSVTDVEFKAALSNSLQHFLHISSLKSGVYNEKPGWGVDTSRPESVCHRPRRRKRGENIRSRFDLYCVSLKDFHQLVIEPRGRSLRTTSWCFTLIRWIYQLLQMFVAAACYYCAKMDHTNFLVRSVFQTSDQPGTFKCARARCKTCPFIRNVEKISGPKRSIKITDHFTCTSANVIYCITCTLCKKLYIGETGRRLGDRFREHLRDVEKDDQNASKPVARHFNLPNHSNQHMVVCGLSLHQGSTESRKTVEQKFIFQIGTLNPNGINERFSFN